MDQPLVRLIGLFLCFLNGFTKAQQVRLCLPSALSVECRQMNRELSSYITCIEARDKLECMRFVRDGQADLVNLDPEEVYLAGKNFNLIPVVMEEVNRATYRYRSGAVVRRTLDVRSLADLRGRSSCHTGMARTAGWNVPVGTLLTQGAMVPDCRGELHTVSNFFGRSCAAGRWSPDAIVDRQLKQQHSNLCALCKNPLTCNSEGEGYSGYQGALQCLVDGAGDVAFTSVEATQDFFRQRPFDAESYELLCVDGSRRGVLDQRPCVWAERPTNAFVGSVASDRERMTRSLQQVFNRYPASISQPYWFTRAFVSSRNVTRLVAVPTNWGSWDTYLGDYRTSIDKELPGCDEKHVRFCVTSPIEEQKCRDLGMASLSKRLRPQVRCVQAGSIDSCMEAVSNRNMDVVALDGGDLYRGGRYLRLTPLVGEQYPDTDAAYYVVAVIRSDSDINRLEDLRGKRSCHTGFGRTEGWLVPVGVLEEKNLLPPHTCDPAGAMSDFFSASCVPGAGDPRYNRNLTGIEPLCRQCIGDEFEQRKCESSPSERYYGFEGAFRCLVEGRGDVAFIKHDTVPSYTDGNGDIFWTRGLRSDNYRLLCRDGGQAPIWDYRLCNLARVPAGHVVMSVDTPREMRMDAVALFVAAGRMFGPNTTTFQLFGPYQNTSDRLFKDGASGLRSVPEGSNYRDVLGDTFYQLAEDLDPVLCNGVIPVPALILLVASALTCLLR